MIATFFNGVIEKFIIWYPVNDCKNQTQLGINFFSIKSNLFFSKNVNTINQILSGIMKKTDHMIMIAQ